MTEKTPKIELRRSVLLAFQVTLLGMVTPQLRGVTVGWQGSTIQGWLLFDGPVGEPQHECASDIEAEIMAMFPDREVEVTAERLDYPKLLNERTLGAWAYQRME